MSAVEGRGGEGAVREIPKPPPKKQGKRREDREEKIYNETNLFSGCWERETGEQKS